MPAPATISAPQSVITVSLDLGERLFVCTLFGFLTYRVLHSVLGGSSWYLFVMLASEALNVVFILLRRPASIVSYKAKDWFLAIGGSTATLLAQPAHVAPLAPLYVGFLISLVGLGCQIWSKLALRFSYGLLPANRGLHTQGPYGIVRHPIYASYLISQVAVLLINPTLWNVSIYAAGLVFQLARIEAEEDVLRQDPAYARYALSVPYRLIPRLY